MLTLTFILIAIINVHGFSDAPSSQKITRNPYPNHINKKEESARKFLQFYTSSSPVILLIDNLQENWEEAYNFVQNVNRLEPRSENINFILMKFNDTGVSPVLETTRNNRIRFETFLKHPIINDSSNFLSVEGGKCAVFFGLLNACQKLTQNGGIVVFIRRGIADHDLSQYAATEVRKKNIRVFVVWGGRDDGSLLKELSTYSGGAFFTSSTRSLSQVHYDQFLESVNPSSISLILSRKDLFGEYNLHFPIDFEVTGIHISITPNLTTGILTTPRGYRIDIMDGEDVAQYSSGSFVRRDGGVHEIHLNTTTATTQDVGMWRFRVENARAYYNITVFAHTELTTDEVVFLRTNKTDIKKDPENKKKVMKLGLNGEVGTIKNISFVSKDGHTVLKSNLKFSVSKVWSHALSENVEHIDSNQKKEITITTDQVPKEPFYAVVNGKDSRGNDFTRLSYVRYNIEDRVHFLPPLIIDVGLGSELITQPYRQPQIFFEVTNNGNTPTFVRFICKDERSILFSMSPWYRWINPQETANVRLTLVTRNGVFQDRITFTAVGSETVSKDVIVDVGLYKDDRRDPELDYYFTSDCLGVLLTSCEDGTWTVEVKAKDTGTGLLQVSSNPRGLYFPNGYTTGTTEEITGYYSESCCNADLQLIAFDRQRNRRTRNINAYRANLGPGAIAAIVLGVILLLLIIIVIILIIRAGRCPCPRTKDSYDLPTYRGPKRH